MLPRHKWKNQYQIIEGNSDFHEQVRVILSTDPFFSRLRCFQEVHVKDLCPTYTNSSHRLDWYIEDLGIVIELHGRQHYEFTNRGSLPFEQAQREFERAKLRDIEKKIAIEDQGIVYKEISYKESAKLSAERLRELILLKE